MRKNLIRNTAVLITAVMIFTSAAGCGREEDSMYVPPEYVYVAESISLPAELGDISRMVYTNGLLYIASTKYERGDETQYYLNSQETKIYTMNIDGTGFSELTGYTPPVTPPPDASGGLYISVLQADNEGNLWVVEGWNHYGYDLPDGFDIQQEDPWQYQIDYGSGSAVRKLSPAGTQILSVDLAAAVGQNEQFYVQTFCVDGNGNIYLTTYDYEQGGTAVFVLDNTGNMRFKLTTDMWINQLIQLPDGTVAFATDAPDEAGNYRRVLQSIDYGARAFGTVTDLPANLWEIYPGSGGYDLLAQDFNGMYGFTLGEEDAVRLFNWVDSDIINNGIQNISMISDEQIICTNYNWDRMSNETSYELLVLTKTPYSSLPQKTILTLATVYGGMRDAVVSFNRTSSDYRIQIIDYSEFNNEDDWNAGLTRLTTELISGKVPDILDVSNLPYKEYAARGLLADLYTFIDSDPDFGRGDFVDGAFRAAEIDGALYQVFPSFYVNTIAGHPSVVGSEPGWSMDEFKAVLDANPNADMPLGQWLTKSTFLQASISYGIDEFIDWNTGTVNFDTPDFIQLLEFANTFPDDIDWNQMSRDGVWEDIYVPEEQAIATGRQIMAQMTVFDFYNYSWYKAMFGGDLVFKGFPNENKQGNSLSVYSGLSIIGQSPNKDAAWQFVRSILDADWQYNNAWAFPTNQATMDIRIKEALEQDYESGDNSIGIVRPMRGGSMIANDFAQPQVQNLTQTDIDKVTALISSANGTAGWNVDQTIWEIISEGTSDYFSGASSAQDVARVIQSRVQILVSERS